MSHPPENLYVNAFHNADTPMILYDLNFMVIDVNKAGQRFTGYTRDEFIDQPVSVIAGDLDTIDDIIETLMRGDSWTGDFSLQTKSGDQIHGLGSTAPITVNNRTKGYVAVFTDTTKQRRYESTSRVLSRLLRHDLRNELNLMHGYIDHAASNTSDPETVKYLTKALNQVTAIIDRTEQLNSLRNMLETSYDAETKPVSLPDTLGDKVKNLRDTYPDADIRLGSIPPVHVSADNLLGTVFDGILENAVVHNTSNTPIVDVTATNRQTEVLVEIKDNGPGIAPKNESVLFGRDGHTDTVHHGSGLSLFFADKIIENYDGDIWIETNEMGGTTFVIRLNVKQTTVSFKSDATNRSAYTVD